MSYRNTQGEGVWIDSLPLFKMFYAIGQQLGYLKLLRADAFALTAVYAITCFTYARYCLMIVALGVA